MKWIISLIFFQLATIAYSQNEYSIELHGGLPFTYHEIGKYSTSIEFLKNFDDFYASAGIKYSKIDCGPNLSYYYQLGYCWYNREFYAPYLGIGYYIVNSKIDVISFINPGIAFVEYYTHDIDMPKRYSNAFFLSGGINTNYELAEFLKMGIFVCINYTFFRFDNGILPAIIMGGPRRSLNTLETGISLNFAL